MLGSERKKNSLRGIKRYKILKGTFQFAVISSNVYLARSSIVDGRELKKTIRNAEYCLKQFDCRFQLWYILGPERDGSPLTRTQFQFQTEIQSQKTREPIDANTYEGMEDSHFLCRWSNEERSFTQKIPWLGRNVDVLWSNDMAGNLYIRLFRVPLLIFLAGSWFV